MSTSRSVLRRGPLWASIFGIAASIALAAAQESAPGQIDDVELRWGVRVPMRDGTELSANLYLPKPMAEALPVIVLLTPYTADRTHDRGLYFARHGYVFAMVDVRGRGNSDGIFRAFQDAGPDGYDLVEWLARQPWCNGRVAMWGGSYAGFTQWATLGQLPPHLATIVPTASVGMRVDSPHLGGIADPYEAQWAAFTAGRTSNERLFADAQFWNEKYRELYVSHTPFYRFADLAGYRSAWFDTVTQHPAHDPFWHTLMPSAEAYRRMTIPILTITGAHDGDQRGALHFYQRHLDLGPAEATARHHLVIGPWDHPGTRTPLPAFGGMQFGPASVVDMNRLHAEWYDWTLKNGPRPAFLRDRVAVYVTGEEAWRYAPTLPAVASSQWRLALGSSGSASDVYRSGWLSEAVRPGAPADQYRFDPRDTTLVRRELTPPQADWLVNPRYAVDTAGAAVIYHSDPLETPITIAGRPSVEAWLSMDVPDTDFSLLLQEVKRDGSAVHLSSQMLRARYRESLDRPVLVQPNRVERYLFDSFTFVARRLEAGSRLRLVLGAQTSVYRQRNYQSGGEVARETVADARVATVTLHHSERYPSTLIVPTMGGPR